MKDTLLYFLLEQGGSQKDSIFQRLFVTLALLDNIAMLEVQEVSVMHLRLVCVCEDVFYPSLQRLILSELKHCSCYSAAPCSRQHPHVRYVRHARHTCR